MGDCLSAQEKRSVPELRLFVRLAGAKLHYISVARAVTRVAGQEAVLDQLARSLGINHQIQAEMEQWVFRDWRDDTGTPE